MGKLSAILDLFRKGGIVADPAAWKNRQITVTMLAGIIVAALHLFGVQLPDGITQGDLDGIAAGIVGIVNVVLTYTTTDKIGLPPKRAGDADPGQPIPDDRASGA